MHLRTYLATTRRILTQLRADKRTVGLIAIVPAALLTLLYFVYRDYPGADLLFNHIAVSMMAILPTTVMFLVTSVAMLRERVSGTLERLWTTPIHRADLLFGYATAFALTAVIQSLILCAVAAWGLDVDISAAWGGWCSPPWSTPSLGCPWGCWSRPSRAPSSRPSSSCRWSSRPSCSCAGSW